jgi:hypothetical protein
LALKGAYADRHLSFRYNPDCTVPVMRWQAGRQVHEMLTLTDGTVHPVERFELVAWGASANDLVAQLA